jgi:hypothetical protein
MAPMNQTALPPVTGSAADSSARIVTTATPPAEFRAPLPAPPPAKPEPIRASPKQTEKDDDNGQVRASPKKPTKPANAKTKGEKLEVKESRSQGQESWTVKTNSKASFRVRLADAGYRVNLRFYDDAGREREPYLCYLSATEWRAARRQSLANFAAQIVTKLEERKAKEKSDAAKLDELIRRVKAFQ